MSVTYTYDTSTEGPTGTITSYALESDSIVITSDSSGGKIYTFSVLTDVWSPSCVVEIRLKRDISLGGTGDFVLMHSGIITPTGGVAWHVCNMPTPITVMGTDEIKISHTSQATFRVYTIATCANHGLAVVRFDVIKATLPGGLFGRYYTNTLLTGVPDVEQIDTTVDFDSTVLQPPGDLSGTTAYSIGWDGFVTAGFSELYTFSLVANGTARLFINDTLLINSTTDTGSPVTTSATINLGADVRYAVRIEFINTVGDGKIQFRWSSTSTADAIVPRTSLDETDPITGDGLVGNYINQDFVKIRFEDPQNMVNLTPTGTRTDGPIDFSWTTIGPGVTGIGGNSYAVKWVGYIEPVLTGTYVFYLNACEGVRLYVDGNLIIDSWIYGDSPPGPIERTSSSVPLTAATRYSLTIHYFYYINSDAEIEFSWSSADTAPPITKTTVPNTVLFVAASGSSNGLVGNYYHTELGSDFGTGNLDGITASELTQSGFMVQRTDAAIDFDWSGIPPGPYGISNILYTVEWNGWIRPQYTELYTFKTLTDDGVRLFIDDTLLIDRWVFQGPASYTGQIRLVAGRFYRLKYQYFQGVGGAIVQFYWSSPSQPEKLVPTAALFTTHPLIGYGLRASYWNNPTFTGTAAATRIENSVDMSGGSLPGAVTAGDFSARWTGYVKSNYSEEYTFYATSEGAVRLLIDGVVTISNETIHSLITDSGATTLAAGRYYAIQVDYWTDGIVTPRLYLEWESANQEREIIDTDWLFADTPPEIITTNSLFLIDGSGVYAEYYDSPAPTGNPVLATAFDGSGTGFVLTAPTWPPALPFSQTAFFSNVWTGFLIPANTGSHYFTITTTGFGRLLIDADTDEGTASPTLVLDFTASGTSSAVPLCALKTHRIRVEHMCLNNTPSFQMQWEGSFRTLQTVPAAAMYNADGEYADGTNIPTGVGNGLNGRYFDNPSFTGDPVLTRTDASGVAYNFGPGSPGVGVPTGVYGVRWEGNINPPITTTYTFYLVGNYGTRLYVSDMSNAIIDSIATPGVNSGTVSLLGGVYPQIKAELAAYNGGDQYAFLSWSWSGSNWALVPAVKLFAGVGNGLLGQYYNAPAANGTVDLTRYDTNFNITWPAGPGGGIIPALFSVVWTGWIRPRYNETYTFRHYNSTVFTRVFIDPDNVTTPLIDFNIPALSGVFSGTRDLSANVLYPIRLEMIAPYSLTFNFTWESASQSEETVPEICLFAVHPETGQSRGDTPGIPAGNGNGLIGRYYNNTTWTPPAALTRIDRNIQFDWGSGSPDPSVNPENFTVSWTGFILPQYSETYTFYTLSDDGIIITINNTVLVNSPNSGGLQAGTIDLSANTFYSVHLQFKELTVFAYVFFMWSSTNRQMSIIPRSRIFTAVGTGIYGQYWTLPAPDGPAVLERTDENIDFTWTGGPPGPGVPEKFYGIVWTGYIKPTFSELYTFDVSGTGWSRVWINDQILIEFSKQNSGSLLVVGDDYYAVRIEHSNVGMTESLVQLNWQSTSQTRQAIPPEAMFLDMSGVDTGPNTVHGTAVPVDYEPPTGYGDGLVGSYFATAEPGEEGNIIAQRTDSLIAFDWSTEPLPGDLSGATTFSAGWRGFLTIPESGDYTFYVISDGAIDMSLNLVSVVNRQDHGLSPSWYDASGTALTPQTYSQGETLVVGLNYSHETGTVPAFVYLAWGNDSQAFTMVPSDVLFTIVGDGIQSRWWAARGPSLYASPTASQTDEIVEIGSLPGGITDGRFFAVWSGWIRSNTTENYTFYLTAQGLARMRIDGVLYIDFDASGTAVAPLLDGNYHFLRVELLSLATPSSVQLEWESAYHTRTVIPNVCYFVDHPYTGENGLENGP